MRKLTLLGLLVLFFVSGISARADVGLMMEQPYGRLGFMSPTGHAAIYLSRVCAATPTRLRRCRPGEHGVVLSRYSHIGGYDWVAVPLVPYLYAVDRLDQVPASITARQANQLRDSYRREHLEGLAPDRRNGKTPKGEWAELVGAAYRRKIYVFEIQTSPAQDDRLIEELNARPNRRRFNFFFRNCANFAESILNFYFPHAVHRSFSADLGLVTPKQIAKSLVAYAHDQDELHFSTFVIPQVPGTIRRSSKVCGVVESLVKEKQYAIPLVVWQPYFAAALVGTYLTRGRFNPAQDSVVLNSKDELRSLLTDSPPKLNRQHSLVERASLRNAKSTAEDCTGECDGQARATGNVDASEK